MDENFLGNQQPTPQDNSNVNNDSNTYVASTPQPMQQPPVQESLNTDNNVNPFETPAPQPITQEPFNNTNTFVTSNPQPIPQGVSETSNNNQTTSAPNMQTNNQGGLDTNKSNTVFGTSSDGRIIASARKIKGELIGGYILLSIAFYIIYSIVSNLLTAPIVAESYFVYDIAKIGELYKKIAIIGMVLSFFSAGFDFLTVFLSSKIVFKKRKVRKVDIQNVLKTIIIIEVVLLCISLLRSIFSYRESINNLDELDAVSQSYETFASGTNKKDYDSIKAAKGFFTGFLVINVLVKIGTAGGCVLLQKKLLEKKQEE